MKKNGSLLSSYADWLFFGGRTGKHFGKVIVDDIDADLLCSLSLIAVLFLQIVDHEPDITLYLLIIGPELVLIEILNRPPEVFVFKKRFKNFFFKSIGAFLVKMQKQGGLGNRQAIAQHLLRQGGGRI